MPEWIIAMFLIGALLSAGDMAKIFLEARRSRREAAVYDNHPQKLQMEHYADSFRVLAESFYQMPSKSVMPETGRVDKILEKEQQEVCSRCAKASWCWEQYGNLTRERCQELLQTIADGDEDEISRAKGEWNASCLNGSRFLELFWTRYQQERQAALWSGRVAESRRVVAEQLSEVAGIMDRAACDLYSLNSLPAELSEKICRQMKKNGAFVQKIWLQERPKEHLQIYMTVKAGRHCRITLRQTAELIGSLCGIPMVAVRGTGLKRRIPDGAVSGGCEIPGSLRCGTHHQGAGEYLRGQLQCALRKRPVCPLPVGRHGFRDRGKQGERDGGGAV